MKPTKTKRAKKDDTEMFFVLDGRVLIETRTKKGKLIAAFKRGYNKGIRVANK